MKFNREETASEAYGKLDDNIKRDKSDCVYRGINYFRRGYQPRSNIVKDENGDLLADSHNILNRLLNVHKVSDVRQTEIHTAKPSVPKPIPLRFKLLLES
jgi:hypothetical protein